MLFNCPCHCLGNERRTAECRAGLDKQGHVGVVFPDVVYLEDIVHRLSGMLGDQVVLRKDLLRRIGKHVVRFMEYPLKIFIITFLQGTQR